MKAHSYGLIGALGLMAAPGCGDDTDQSPPPATQITCSLAVEQTDGSFVDAAQQPDAELKVGFQGYLFATGRVTAQAEVSATCDLTVSVSVGTAAPETSVQRGIGMTGQPDGSYESSDLMLFLNGAVSDYEQEAGEISVGLACTSHFCATGGIVTFVNDDPCIHTGAEPICP